MIVNSHELRVWECLRHEDGRGAMPAADVSYLPTVGQLLLDPAESRNPGLSQVRSVPVPKERLGSSEQSAIVLVPAHSLARAEGGEDLVFPVPQRSGYVESWRKKCRAVRIRQHKTMFRWQQVFVGSSV